MLRTILEATLDVKLEIILEVKPKITLLIEVVSIKRYSISNEYLFSCLNIYLVLKYII